MHCHRSRLQVCAQPRGASVDDEVAIIAPQRRHVLRYFYTQIMNIDKVNWRYYKDGHQYVKDGLFGIPFLYADCYDTVFDNVEYTLGIYKYRGREVFKAWGVRGDPDCSGHSLTFDGGVTWTEPIYTCPAIDLIIENGKITGFAVMYDHRVYLYTDSNIPTVKSASDYAPSNYSIRQNIILYRPLILSALTAVIAGSLLTVTHVLSHDYMMNIMGIFIIIIGLLKFKNKSNFENMFISYDPIAMRTRSYAKLYPYLEVMVGVISLISITMMLANVLIIIIYSVTTFGIARSLRRGERLSCACVGGAYTIPLSRVTIFENAVMILMSVYGLATLV